MPSSFSTADLIDDNFLDDYVDYYFFDDYGFNYDDSIQQVPSENSDDWDDELFAHKDASHATVADLIECMGSLQLPDQIDGSVCPICRDALDGASGGSLPCSHTFHADCLRPWLKIDQSCPMCRQLVIPPCQK